MRHTDRLHLGSRPVAIIDADVEWLYRSRISGFENSIDTSVVGYGFNA